MVRLDPKDAVGAIDVYRTAPGLYNLRRSKAIDQAHVIAANMWARDYETGILGASDPERAATGKRGDLHDVMLARAAASARCEHIRKAIGRVGENLLIMLMIDGLPLDEMANRLAKHRRNISGASALVLEQTIELYDEMPGAHWRD
ncbi:hypothetical protein HLH26_07160 [Gluconacetobacter sp. 1b LMG 1731]|uniref:Uncharacterized protein n=1 Tax=Gluconacetobacter dulcium TaxID=2729096 RepID=A0A7W4NSB3_9PROT|nr:hypothetical protein [Gluconacetobacter dulcium]MBB2164322.1 hypothetical protein [Gluconacetobacter dulcium]MBB2193608.1 hypothetical protein [Gluconacetobacter dulcium]